GNTIDFDANTFSFAADIDNTSDIQITVNGQALTISAGSSLSAITSNRDSFITQGGPNGNEGANTILRIISSDKNRPVVAFDQQQIQLATSGKTLQSAKLRLYIVDNGNNWGFGKPIGSYRLLDNWVEGNGWNVGNNIAGTGSGTTWNCPTDTNISNNQKNCDAQWNGGSFNLIPTNTLLITNSMNGQWIEFDVTSDVQGFLDGVANYGWVIKKTGDDSLNGSIEFASREASVNKPQLVLSLQGQ
ncbi:MAG: DNRLRE domain-containing protein, partial [Candidatus Nitrosotenuis sp.]